MGAARAYTPFTSIRSSPRRQGKAPHGGGQSAEQERRGPFHLLLFRDSRGADGLDCYMSKLTHIVELIGETAHRAPDFVPADEVSAANLPLLGARQQSPRFALVESKHRGNADFESIVPPLLPEFLKRIIHHFYLAALAAPVYSTTASAQTEGGNP